MGLVAAHEPHNYLDADGLPICMVCGHNIRPADFAARVDDCLVHGRLREAFAVPEPCEPQRSEYFNDV
jgi:hypothetical protein